MGRSIRGKAQSRYEIVENVSVKYGSNKKTDFCIPCSPAKWGEKVMLKLKLYYFSVLRPSHYLLKKYNISQGDPFSLVITEGFAIFFLCKIFSAFLSISDCQFLEGHISHIAPVSIRMPQCHTVVASPKQPK